MLPKRSTALQTVTSSVGRRFGPHEALDALHLAYPFLGSGGCATGVNRRSAAGASEMGDAERHSALSVSVRKILEWLDGHEARQLGRLSVTGSSSPTSEAPIFGANQTVREVGSSILPEEKRLFNGVLVLELNVRGTQQTR